jgi:hypothetical protein
MKERIGWLALLLAGIVLGQAILYGPSLLGRRILLPLDILPQPIYYIPRSPGQGFVTSHNIQLADLITSEEPGRRFLGAELRSGRFPLWNPYEYAGAPDIRPKFSPFLLLGASVASPKIIPWIELLKALICGLGTYCFCRQVLQVAHWPAVVAGWCYPLTGFFIFWQGFSAIGCLVWFPWLLLAVSETVLGSKRLAAPFLSVITWLVLVSGQLDLAGQALLASGLFALWCLADNYRAEWLGRRCRTAVLALACAWGLGLLLAAPYILPLLDYSHSGVRVARRSAGREERPPVGPAALPQVIMPHIYGSAEEGSLPLWPKGEGGLAESTSATYAGLVATLLVAPLAWCSRRHRSINAFWAFLALFALSWSLNIPGFVDLLRLPGLNLMSHNRFVFAASFAFLALGAVGLDVLWGGQFQGRAWFWVPIALLAGLGIWSAVRTIYLPEQIGFPLEAKIMQGEAARWVHDMQGVRRVQGWFGRMYATTAVLCGLGVAAGLFIWIRRAPARWFVWLLGGLMLADLVMFGFGRAAQCDPKLYYPPVPALQEITQAAPGRTAGFNCLPANLATILGLYDIRGYDGVDPSRLTELLMTVADPRWPGYPYAQVQWLAPRGTIDPNGDTHLPPILNMLGVRYVVFRGSPPRKARPIFQSPDYWVAVNSNALERAFIPRRVEAVTADALRLEKLTSPEFDPREVAYVESRVDLPAACRGRAEITGETPTRINLSLVMETPGLMVLADRWDKGWKALLNGKFVPILRANHALRGIVVPAGNSTLELRYSPASFAWGLSLAGVAAITLLVWAAVSAARPRLSKAR